MPILDENNVTIIIHSVLYNYIDAETLLKLKTIVSDGVSLQISHVPTRSPVTPFSLDLSASSKKTSVVSTSSTSSLVSSSSVSDIEEVDRSMNVDNLDTSTVQNRSIMLTNLAEEVNTKDTLELYFEDKMDQLWPVECDKRGRRAIITLLDYNSK